MAIRKSPMLFALIFVVVLLIAITLWWKLGQSDRSEAFSPLDAIPETVEEVKKQYDVVVVGTDPEGVMAAVSAARNGLKTLLIDSKNREILGGLFTLGWLNSLDMNRSPGSQKDYLNKGLFKEWFDQVEGDSFDVTTAAVVFNRMVKGEKNIDLLLKMKAIEPVVMESEGVRTVIGVKLTKEDGTQVEVEASSVIDATQDADIAAAAGAPFTFGREDIGDPNSLMVVTPVFKLKNVTNDVWAAVKKRLNGDDDSGTGANEVSAWGYAKMWQYPSTQPDKLRTRGLNIGRQNDETILINSIQVFNMNGLDPSAREQTMALLDKELPLMLTYLKENFPEFESVELAGLAPELYVRETRHLIGEYRLTILDLLEQRDQWDVIGYGSYEVDIQSTSPTDNGWVQMQPEQYAVPFRSLVPKAVDGLLVVGRSASFDTLPHGSARVVPLGMATGEAAGAAAKVAADAGVSLRELSASKALVKKLQTRLTEQGVDLVAKKLETPNYMKHYSYEGLKAVVSIGIANGSYSNDFKLDDTSNPQRMVNNVKAMMKAHKSAFPGNPNAAIAGMAEPAKQSLTLEQAAYTIVMSGRGAAATTEPSAGIEQLLAEGWLSDATIDLIPDPAKLTNGDVYLLLADALKGAAGIMYE